MFTVQVKKYFKELDKISKREEEQESMGNLRFTIKAKHQNKDSKEVSKMRQSYFEKKNEIMEMSVVLNQAFKDYFTDVEQKMSTTKILTVNFNQVVNKMKNSIEENEMKFFQKT
jgi:hypothetical protein